LISIASQLFPSPSDGGGCGWPPAQRASGSERGERQDLVPPPLYPLPPREGRFLRFILSDKATDRTIKRSFTLRGEETAWKLLHPPVIGDALTTSSLAVTGLISTGASLFVFF